MESGKFLRVAAGPNNKNWDILIRREQPLYSKVNDIRTEFDRDYTRILHSLAYRRLKHKTQVFFNTHNDHICTRIEHVNHVESVSYTIAKFLGLNMELTKAIAIGHDLGHTPFGHQGETVMKQLSKMYLKDTFWHEKNGLHCVDNIELLEDDKRNFHNLDLTYAVRDGIISHCGEIDENAIIPRKDDIDLYKFNYAGKYQPYTWEACVVKISDKISYIGRDIEDAFRLSFIGKSELRELIGLARKYNYETLNTTRIIHELIIDLCKNSSPDVGLMMSSSNIEMMDEVKKYNYKNIYTNEKFDCFKKYVELVLTSIFDILFKMYDADKTLLKLEKSIKIYPELSKEFSSWLIQHSELLPINTNLNVKKYRNKKLYKSLENKELYAKSIIDFISGMTDQYAIRIFNEISNY